MSRVNYVAIILALIYHLGSFALIEFILQGFWILDSDYGRHQSQ